MYAKQYEITLPADYDMGIIRKRVAAGGHVLDDRPGLGLKAYLMRERGVDGSPVNQYAPFYLWNDPGAMAHFLFGGGFHNIVRDFGRPVVRHFTGLAAYAGPARSGPPTKATRRITPIPPPGEPDGMAALVEREIAELSALGDGMHTAALAVDPHHWQLLRFVLWRDAVSPEESGDRYEVLHLSVPGLDALPDGRCW
ncbi:DUF4865 family protein [Hamadaea sp. NPDC050747]|uniref:DUF4865 family protein n=1 Tax=Hamadaea sp. NPDC050747 TaxID=3155789 RepID=UPI0033E298E7